MSNINPGATMEKMMSEGGISAQTISTLQYAGINLHRWLHGFDSVYDSVRNRCVQQRSWQIVRLTDCRWVRDDINSVAHTNRMRHFACQ